MKKINKELINNIFPILAIIFVFILFALLAQQYSDEISKIMSQHKVGGAFLYIGSIIITITIAPLTSIPLIPIAVTIWGVFWTSIFSIIGWTLGAISAFFIARTFGHLIVSKLINLEKIEKVYSKVPAENLFWYLILLRMVTPVDLLSYAIGLFTNIGWRMYISTTIIGVTPPTFALAYLGSFPAKYQLMAFLFVFIFLLFFLFIKHKKKLRGGAKS